MISEKNTIDSTKAFEEIGCDIMEKVRGDIRVSNNGRLRLLVFDYAPLILGTVVGGVSRIAGAPWMIGILPGYKLVSNPRAIYSKRKDNMVTMAYIQYGIGTALPYADKIYYAAVPMVHDLSELVQQMINNM